MEAFLDRVLFSADDRPYRWSDVALSAHLDGAWAQVERHAREGLACLKRRAAEEQEGDRGIRSLAEAFRYERNLLSADETEEWLDRHGLAEDDWMGYIRRMDLRDRWAEELPEIVERFAPAEDEVRSVVLAEAVCSGALTRAAEALSARAALALQVEATPAETAGASATATAAGVPTIPGIDPAFARSRLGELAEIALLASRVTDAAVTEEAIEREVESNTLEWISFRCSTVYTIDADSAKEVLAQIRDDDRPIEEVARDAGSTLRTGRVFLDGMSGTLHDRMVGAGPGDVVGPVETGEGWLILQVDEKIGPEASDPEIRERATAAIVRRLEEREKNALIRWHERL